jgi:hypothetical protein
MQSEYGDVNHILVPLDVLPNFATLSVDPDALAVEWRIGRGLMISALARDETLFGRRLRKKLQACDDTFGKACNLPMCPTCVEKLRRSLILEVTRCLGGLANFAKIPMSRLNADLPGQQYEVGELHRLDLPSLNQSIHDRYARAHFPLTFSSVRLVAIEHVGSAKPVWQARVNSLIVGAQSDLVRNFLIKSYRSQPPKHWPGKLCIDDVLFCAVQPEFYHETEDETEDYCIRLTPPQLAELARWLAQCEMSDRYVLSGCSWRDGRIRLAAQARESLRQRGLLGRTAARLRSVK